MSEQATLDVSLIFNAHGEHEVGKEDTAVERLEELFDRHRVRQRVEPNVTVTLPEEQEIDLGDWTFPEVINHNDVLRMVKDQEGITGEILSATGLRALDNAVRFSIRKHGPIRPVAGNWTPIWDWSKQKLLDTIEQSGISLPPDYTFLPRSFDGFSYLFLMPLKEHYPRDYQRVPEWFTLAPAEILGFEIHQRLSDASQAKPE
jgi:hypothetical protein